ncbi:MAG: DUF2207 domain-containing protein [Anaerolineae bacterium]|nr:DUF2207 domain-containing protein [Anaerolineae bacterium]
MRFKRSFYVALALLLMVVGIAYAQGKTLYWQRLDVEITVNEDGTFRVEETQEIVFTSGTFTFGYRDIDMRWLESISDVEVREGGRMYQPSGSGAPYTFSTSREGGDFRIRWNFPETGDSTHIYTLAYTVHGGLRYYESGDQIWWKAVFPDRSFPVNSSQVTVHLPAGAEVQQFESYFSPATAQQLDARTVVFTADGRIGPGEELEVRVQFTHGVVAGAPAAWQKQADEEAAELERRAEYEATTQPMVNLAVGALSLFFLIMGPVGLYALWYTKGRDVPVKLVADYLPEPPSDLPPSVAGTLLDEEADMEDILAGMVDLARRGVMEMEEVEEPGFLGIGSRQDFIYRLKERPADLRPYEKTLLDNIFGKRQERKLSDLKEKFYTAIPELKKQLYQEVVDLGFFRRSPERVRATYAGLGIGLLVVVAVAGVCGATAFSQYTPYAFCLPVSLGVSALGLILIARFMPRKTQAGSEAAARWNAFKRYLRDIEKYTNLEEAKDIFERYLPYAIAFGLDKEFINKFARVEAPAPQWYRPVGGPVFIPGSGQQRPIMGVPSPATEGGRIGRAAPSPGEGRPAPSLSEASRGLGTSLASMSAGLGSMLSSASRTLGSRPAPSGGGGWSGGGGFGGGGGGGGGGGFG